MTHSGHGVASHVLTNAGRLGSNVQPGMRNCIAAASSRPPMPEALVARVRRLDLRHVDLDAEAGPLGHRDHAR